MTSPNQTSCARWTAGRGARLAVAFGLMGICLLGLVTLSHAADIFNGKGVTEDNSALAGRVMRLEQLLGNRNSSPSAPGAAPGTLDLPPPPEINGGELGLGSPAFELLGNLNGKVLVRENGHLRLMTKDEYQSYHQVMTERAKKRLSAGMVDTTPTTKGEKPRLTVAQIAAGKTAGGAALQKPEAKSSAEGGTFSRYPKKSDTPKKDEKKTSSKVGASASKTNKSSSTSGSTHTTK